MWISSFPNTILLTDYLLAPLLKSDGCSYVGNLSQIGCSACQPYAKPGVSSQHPKQNKTVENVAEFTIRS
jgi:hypothetical protein